MNSEMGLLILPIFLVLYLLLVVYCLYDVLKASFRTTFDKRLWILVILAAPLLGSLVYLVFGRKQKLPS